VSPLSSPHQKHRGSHHDKSRKDTKNSRDDDLDTNRINTNVFYDALHNEFNRKMDSVLNNLGSNHNRGGSSRPLSSTMKTTTNNNSNSMNDLYANLDHGTNNNSLLGSRLFNLDEENRRLLIKIIKEKEKALGGGASNIYMHKPVRLTSAALNRQREQQRIERENQKILKRLLQVKGSKITNRDEQMKDYERNFGIASLNYTRSSSAGGFRSGFTNSMTSLNAKSGGGQASGTNSRLSSAKSTRSKRDLTSMDASELLRHAARLSQKRPEWVERW
jgi:hypothetical protein